MERKQMQEETNYLFLEIMTTNFGENLSSLTKEQPVMLIFLRHFGCTFCREELDELSKKRAVIEDNGTKIVLVHMSDNAVAEKYFKEYNLPNITHISDIECQFYANFGLVKANMNQLFGLSNWARAFNTAIVKGYGWGAQIGDGFQMPGIFILQNNEVKASYIHKFSADQTDFIELSKCCAV